LLTLCLVCSYAAAQLTLPGEGPGLDPKLGWEPRNLISLTNPGRSDTLYPVNVNNWWGYMNQEGRLVVFPRYDWADSYYDGLARAVVSGKTGFIKGNGHWVHEPVYVYADRFSEGRAIVGDGKHFGFIEKSGKTLVQVRLDGALRFNEGVAVVMKDGLCGYINVAGDMVIPFRFTRARSFHEGFAAVSLPSRKDVPEHVGYIDRRGRIAFSDSTGSVSALGDFNDGMARVKGREKWGYLGRNWKLRIDAKFDDARDFTNGVAAVRVGEKWGFIDKTGKFVIQPIYDSADDLDDNMIMVTVDGKIGYINRRGSVSIDPQFDTGLPFFRNYARVGLEPSFAYISVTGSPVWDPRQAVKGFVNNRSTERVAISQNEKVNRNRAVDPPVYRDPIPAPYPPEHLYEEVLISPVQ
jgi:hypothetical protein